jgi:hypothetical protein
MARRPFFGQNDTKIAKMDMQAATAPGRAYAAAFKGLGEDIGGAIEKYQLNKEKRNKLQATLEGQLKSNPSIIQELTMSGDEQSDKKNQALVEKILQGDGSTADLERMNGLLAGRTLAENNEYKRREQLATIGINEATRRLKESEAKVSELTEGVRSQQEFANLRAKELASELAQLEFKLKQSKNEADRAKIQSDIDLNKVKTEEQSLNNKLFVDTYADLLNEQRLANEKTISDIKGQTATTENTRAGTEKIEKQTDLIEAQKDQVIKETEQIGKAKPSKISSNMEDELSVYYGETRDMKTGLLSDPDYINFIGTGLEDDDIAELKLNPQYEKMLLSQGRGDERVYKLSLALQALKDPLAPKIRKEQAKKYIEQYK